MWRTFIRLIYVMQVIFLSSNDDAKLRKSSNGAILYLFHSSYKLSWTFMLLCIVVDILRRCLTFYVNCKSTVFD